MEPRCGTSIAIVVVLLLLTLLCFAALGTHALIQRLVLRAGVESRDAAFLIALFLTPVVLFVAGLAVALAFQ